MAGDLFRLSAREAYDQLDMPDEEFYTIVDNSLNPRSSDMLNDKLGTLVAGNDSAHVLDAGCRDATHMCEIAERFGCRVSGIDIVAAQIRLAQEKIVLKGLAEQVDAIQGDIQSMSFPDGAFDVVWCRDMLSLIPDLRKGFSECARVLKDSGHMLAFTVFATKLLESGEAERLYAPLGVVADNMSADFFENALRDAGLSIVERDWLRSEWREWREEKGDRKTSQQMLRIARMLRARDDLIASVGRKDYEVELADCYWGVYQMIGKLSPVVYILRPSQRPHTRPL